MMIDLIHAEWFKLVRRPLAWVLLLIFLALQLLQHVAELMVVGLHDGSFSGGAPLSFAPLLSEAQVSQFRLHLGFPGVFGAVLGQVNGVGGICAIVLAAGAMGSEYGWGTLRTQLARQPSRSRYLLAKLAALLLTLLAGIGLALLLGALLALLSDALRGAAHGDLLVGLLALPLGVLRALYVLLPYVLFTIASAILGRSVVAGAAGGFLFLVADAGLGALAFLARLGGPVGFLLSLVIQPNISTLIVLNGQSFGLDPAALSRTLDLASLPAPLHALLVIGAYSLLFYFYAHRWLLRRDVTGAS